MPQVAREGPEGHSGLTPLESAVKIQETQIRGDMDQAYLETYKRFHKKATELRESKLLPQILSVGFSVKGNQSGFSLTVKKPDETDLRAYLTTFRQFIMKSERIYMDGIYGTLQEHLGDEKFKGYLNKSKVLWQKAHNEAGIALIYNGRELSPLEITDLFLYGDIFHSDVKKEAALNELPPPLRDLFMFQFLEFIHRATIQILYVDQIVNKALEENLFV